MTITKELNLDEVNQLELVLLGIKITNKCHKFVVLTLSTPAMGLMRIGGQWK